MDRLHRQSIRLPDYDYTHDGAYFLTLCAYKRECMFGNVDGDGNTQLNAYGQIVQEEWLKTAVVRPYVVLDEYLVMPNHFHAILFLVGGKDKSISTPENTNTSNVGATYQVAPTRPNGPKSGSIGAIVGQFKRKSTIRINEARNIPGTPVWQRNYYESVIRNESALNDIRMYIQTNAACWAQDSENPANAFLELRS